MLIIIDIPRDKQWLLCLPAHNASSPTVCTLHDRLYEMSQENPAESRGDIDIAGSGREADILSFAWACKLCLKPLSGLTAYCTI